MTVLPFQKPENSQKPGPEPRDPQTPPLFNIPPLTKAVLAAIAVIQLALLFGPADLVAAWGYRLAFVPARYMDGAMPDVWGFVSPFTHMFLHGGWMHLAMNGMMLLAFGAAAERMLGAQRSAVLFVLCGLGGVLVQFLINPYSPVPMIGASGALSGLFAAVLLRLQQAGQMPAGRWGIWGLAALWIGLSYVSALVGGAAGMGNVAWAAHAGGFIAGILFMRLRYFG